MILESLHQNDRSDDAVEFVSPMSDIPTFKEWAKETLGEYRSRTQTGSLVGERFGHRPWPPEVVLAFLAAPIIRPEKGEIQRKLYGRTI